MDINIWLNESYLSTATDLSIARTTIHESVHAILVYMLEEGKFTSVTGNPDPEFKDLVEAFINFNANKPSNYGKAHHEIMSELVAEMASSLSNDFISVSETNFAKKTTFIVSLFIFSNKFSKSINASCLYSFKGSL